MKFEKTSHIAFIFLMWIICIKGIAQNKQADSAYIDFFKTANSKLKFEKAVDVVQLLGINEEFEKAEKIITDIGNAPVSTQDALLKKGMVNLTKAILSKTMDSTELSMKYAKQSIPLLSSNANYLATANGLVVRDYYVKGMFDSCVIFGNTVMEQVKKSGNVNSQLEVLMCVGRSYDFLGNRKKGVQLSLEACQIAKTFHKNIKLSEIYISLSTIFKSEDVLIGKKYALLSLEVLKDATGEDKSVVLNSSYLILGNVYYDMIMLDSSLYYYNLCKESALKTKDWRTYLSAIGNIGNVAYKQKKYDKAIEYNLLTLTEYKKIGTTSEIAVAYGSLADIYKDVKEYDKAIKYYDSALVVTSQIHSADDFIYNYKGLSEIYETTGNYKEAFKYYKLYKQWNDSINNNQNSKKIAQIELDYRYKAEQKEKDLIQKNRDMLTQQKISRQKYIIWAAVLGGLLLLVFLAFTVKTNIARKKTNAKLQHYNDEIIRQKNIIEEKSIEITDSITYASRIQQGVIPDEEEMNKLFPQHFVFFKPRDIVSGDFYWANSINSKTNSVLLAVVDCTGHGVPGAFMSLVGNTLLNQTLNNPIVTTPSQALDYINQQLPKTIKSKTSTGIIKDGMEIAMCEFNFDTLTLHFSGANTNIYIVRNNTIQIYKGNKQPIGESASGNIIAYTTQTIALQKNDCVYLITDGYADQFGGEKGKKFKYKPLEDLFCEVASKPVGEQKQAIADTFSQWKKDHEQVDDVLVLGIKI